MTTPDIEPVFRFLAKLTPFPREEGGWLRLDDRHRLGVTGNDGGTVTFLYFSLIADDWVLQSMLTFEPGPKFWVRVVEAIKTFATYMGLLPPFTVSDEEVAFAIASGLPEAPHLTQERARERDNPPPRPGPKRSASLPEPGTRVVKSKRKTVTREVQPEEPDILDQ